MELGVARGMVYRGMVVTTDASNMGWGGAVRGQTDLCPLVEGGSRASHQLEMLAVCRACQFFLPDLKGHLVLIHSDNMSVLSHINHQGGLSSKHSFTLVKRLLEWA